MSFAALSRPGMTSEFAPRPPTPHALESSISWLDQVLARFEPSSLEELDRVALLNRTDTKFLLGEPEALSIFPDLVANYRVLDIRNVRRHAYRTVYFDTPDWYLYHQHRTNQPVRHKVRSRIYLDSGIAFLEVKSKDDHGRTIKHRTPTPRLMTRLTAAGISFVATYLPIDAASLGMVLSNEFSRVTLVHCDDAERLTLDFGLRFDHKGRGFALPGVVIAEVKQSGLNPDSPFLRVMSARHEPPSSVSKYCVGVARLNPDLDREAFEPALESIEKLIAR